VSRTACRSVRGSVRVSQIGIRRFGAPHRGKTQVRVVSGRRGRAGQTTPVEELGRVARARGQAFGSGAERHRGWWAEAACRGTDPELFFPDGGSTSSSRRQEARAKEICASCPVSRQCLVWALGTGQPAGVWGGATESERRALARNAKRTRLVGAGRA
jgi:WhiB family redox-sensing transcriptional regulator